MRLNVLHQHDFVGIHLQVAVSQLHLYVYNAEKKREANQNVLNAHRKRS